MRPSPSYLHQNWHYQGPSRLRSSILSLCSLSDSFLDLLALYSYFSRRCALSDSFLSLVRPTFFQMNFFFTMALNPTYSNLAENERKILHAGRIPYEIFRVRHYFSPFPPQVTFFDPSCFDLAKICFHFPIFGEGRRKFNFYRKQSSQCLAYPA